MKEKRKPTSLLKWRGKEVSNAPKRPPSVLFCSEHHPQIKEQIVYIGDAAKKLGEMWNNTATDKQSRENKAAKVKGKDPTKQRKTMQQKRGVIKAEQSEKQNSKLLNCSA